MGGHYPLFIWVTFGLVGLAVARLGLERPELQRRLLGIGAAMAVVAYGLGAVVSRAWTAAHQVAPSGPEPDAFNTGVPAVPAWEAANWQHAVLAPEAHFGGLLDIVGSVGVALAVLAACLIVCRRPLVARLTGPLRAAGSMPLTVYVLHVLTASAVTGNFAWQEGFRGTIEKLLAAGTPIPEIQEELGRMIVEGMVGQLILLVASLVAFPLLATLWKKRFCRGPVEELLQRAVKQVTADRPPVRF